LRPSRARGTRPSARRLRAARCGDRAPSRTPFGTDQLHPAPRLRAHPRPALAVGALVVVVDPATLLIAGGEDRPVATALLPGRDGGVRRGNLDLLQRLAMHLLR